MQVVFVWIFLGFCGAVVTGECDCGCGVGFSAYMSNTSAVSQSQSMQNGTGLIFDQTTANTHGLYNTTSGRFKAPSDGMYAFTWTICADSRFATKGDSMKFGEFGTELINGRGICGYLHVDTETQYEDACSTAFVMCHVSAAEHVYLRNVCAHQGRLLSKDGQTRTTFSGWKLFN